MIKLTKGLTNVPEVAQIQSEFVKVKEWDTKIQGLTDVEGEIDLSTMRTEVDKARKEIHEKYQSTFDCYLEQINACENWNKDAEEFLS